MKFINTKTQLPPDDSLIWIKLKGGNIIIGCTYTELDAWSWCEAIESPHFYDSEGKWFADCEIEDLDVIGWARFPN
jgi:hypothetical protein